MTGRYALAVLLLAGPAWAEIGTDSWQYSCDRGGVISVAYISDEDSAAAVLMGDGRQGTLIQTAEDGDVSRFVSPFDRPDYVWLSGIGDGRLLWSEAGAETLLLTCGAIQ